MKSHTIQEDTIQPLVPAITSASAPSTSRPKLTWLNKFRTLIKLSNAAIVILCWNAIVGATYGIIFNVGLALGFVKSISRDIHINLYGLLGVIMLISMVQFLLYPAGGLIADIWCGRYRIVALSTIKIWCGYGCLIILIFLLAFTEKKYTINKNNGDIITYTQGITLGIAAILFLLGFTGFQANVVQFGLDQFQDAPSEDLSLFLHWFVWTDNLGQAVIKIMISLVPCVKYALQVLVFTPVVVFTILTALIVVSHYKRNWFHCEPRTQNPYGTVYRVLKFAAKHNRPLRRSAWTYSDDEIPTRIDFAKQRFGGPFTTETVEDVKTFLRILVMLVAIGPIYIVYVAAWDLLPFHGIYTGRGAIFDDKTNTCKGLDWMVLVSGNMTLTVSIVFIPLYVKFILPNVKKYLPKILFRIGVGLVLLFLADLSMTLTQLAGHYNSKGENITCFFNVSYHDATITTLGLSPWTLVVPNVLDGLAMPIIYISILEFISAQSPHSMKGVLLGVFYAVRGLFTLIGCVLVFPFASERLWENRNGLFDCGLSYYVTSVLLGLFGVVLFCAAARWYRYRVRGDQPWGPHYVEACFQRYMEEDVASAPVARALTNNSILDYGTMVGIGM